MSKGRMWLCTLNNPDVTIMEDYIKLWVTQGGAVFSTGQIEQGAQGTVHLQYFIHFKDQVRMSALKKHCKRSHFTLVKKNNGADDYCNKEETRIDGPWSHGVRPARHNQRGDKAR